MRWAILAALLFFLGGGAVYLYRHGYLTPAPKGIEGPAASTASPTPVRITAAALFAEYRENEFAAERKYKEQQLIVSGIVRAVQTTKNGQHIRLVAEGFFDVVCIYASDGDPDQLANVKRGQKLAVYGPNTGSVASEPVLNPCLIDEDTVPARMLGVMDGYAIRMCECKEKRCVDKVNAEMTAWGVELAKAPERKPDTDTVKKSADIMSRYTECMTKLMAP